MNIETLEPFNRIIFFLTDIPGFMKKLPSETGHILRISRLKEYASH